MSVLKRNNVKAGDSKATPMMFAHGFGCDQNMWRHVAPAFADEYKVVLFDHVGAGRSDLGAYNPQRYSSLERYAEDLLEICEALALRDIVLVGHSVSAMIAVLAAARRPDYFSRLVLIGPSPRYVNDGDYYGGFEQEQIDGLLNFLEENYLGWARAMAPAIMGNLERPELGAELSDSFCRFDPVVAKQFARLTFTSDNRADLLKVKTPALILQCTEDPIAPEPVGRYVHQQLDNSRFIQLRATGHCPNMSSPDETIAAIRSFL